MLPIALDERTWIAGLELLNQLLVESKDVCVGLGVDKHHVGSVPVNHNKHNKEKNNVTSRSPET